MESEENKMINAGTILSIGGVICTAAGAVLTNIADTKNTSREIEEQAEKIAEKIISKMDKGTK